MIAITRRWSANSSAIGFRVGTLRTQVSMPLIFIVPTSPTRLSCRSSLVDLASRHATLEREVGLAREAWSGLVQHLARAGCAIAQQIDDHARQRLRGGDVGKRFVHDRVVRR